MPDETPPPEKSAAKTAAEARAGALAQSRRSPLVDALADESADPKFVTALARGLTILRAFRRDEIALPNQTLAQRTGLPKATVTRLTYTLCKLGCLVQDTSGNYRLGPGVLALGYGVLAGMDLRNRAEAELAELCRGDNPNVAAALGERHAQSVVYLVTHRSPSSVAMAFHLGAQVPLFHSSIGRAILMALPEAEQEALLDDARRGAAADESERLARGLERARADFAAHGFCTSFGEWRKEINGIAAPVVPVQEGGRIYAVNVGGFAFLNPEETLMRDYAPRLLRAVHNLSLRPMDDD